MIEEAVPKNSGHEFNFNMPVTGVGDQKINQGQGRITGSSLFQVFFKIFGNPSKF